MRILLAIIITAAVAWAGYWFIGSRAVQSGIIAWFDDHRAEGWLADYSGLSVRGFPNRFDTSFTDIELADPRTGLGWKAPFFQLMTLSYKPNHVIAVWPHEQQITTPGGSFALHSSDMRASLVVKSLAPFAPERSTLTAENLSLAPEHGPGPISLAALRLAAERAVEDADTGNPRYHLGLAAKDLAPPAELLAELDPSGSVPRVIESLSADLTVDFTAPWDEYAIAEGLPQPTHIEVKRMAATWGSMTLEARGTLAIDTTGVADGLITVKARNWRDVLKLVESSGALDPELANTTEQALAALAGASGSDKTLEIPLKFSGGRIWLGPLPIAISPLMHLR